MSLLSPIKKTYFSCIILLQRQKDKVTFDRKTSVTNVTQANFFLSFFFSYFFSSRRIIDKRTEQAQALVAKGKAMICLFMREPLE